MDSSSRKNDLANFYNVLTDSITLLTEHVKGLSVATDQIPQIMKRLDKCEKNTKDEIAKIKGRLLMNQEVIGKLWWKIDEIEKVGTKKCDKFTLNSGISYEHLLKVLKINIKIINEHHRLTLLFINNNSLQVSNLNPQMNFV